MPSDCSGHSDSVSALAFSSDGALLASGGLDGVVCLWDAATQEQKAKLEGPSGGIEARATGTPLVHCTGTPWVHHIGTLLVYRTGAPRFSLPPSLSTWNARP